MKALKGEKLLFPYTYLNKASELMMLNNRVNTAEDLLNIDLLQEALEVRALIEIHETFTRISESPEKDESVMENELFAQDRLRMITAHIECLTVEIYRSEFNQRIPSD
jgi:hypothetical protein